MGKNQSASNLTNIIKQDANGNITFVSGSTTLMSVSSSGAIATTGNVAGTASYASNAELFDGLDSTVFTLTSSFAAQTASFTAFTASQNILNGTYATTGSNTFTGIQTVNSNLIVTGSITAQTLVVQTITSSVDFVTGSTRFGSIAANTHVFTGSVTMNPGGLFVSSSGLVGIGNIVPAYTLDVSGTGRFTTSTSGNVLIVGTTYASGRNIQIGISDGSILPTAAAYINDNTGVGVYIGDNSASTKGLYVKNGGNVGIGTISPTSILQVKGTGTYDYIAISNGSTSGGGGILTQQNATASSWFGNSGGWEGGTSNDTGIGSYAGGIRFYTAGGTEKMRIASDGKVGIGRTPTTYTLEVNGGISATSGFIGNSSTTTQPKSLYYTSANFTSGTTGGTETANVSGYYLPYMTPIMFKLNINWIGNGSIQNNYIGFAQAVYWNNGTATIIWTANGISGGAGYPSVSVSVEGSAYNTRYLRISLTAEASTRPNQWNWAIDYWYPTP